MWIHAKHNEDPALHYDGQTVTYAALHEKLERIMFLLNSNRLTRMRAAVDLPDSFTSLLWTIANWNVGNAVLPLDRRLKPAEKEWRLADYAPDIVISPFADAADAADAMPSFHADVPVQIRDYDIERRYRARRAEDECEPDPALLVLYTSGSTGIPKRIVRTSSSLSTELKHYGQEPLAPDAHSRVLCLAPIAHAYGLLSACLHTLHVGGTVFFPSAMRPQELAGLIERAGITHVYGVPFHYRLLEKGWQLATRPAHPPVCVCSGGPCPRELADRFRRLGIKLTEQYGMSEVGYIAVDFTGRTNGAVGPIADHHRWRLDDEGQLLLELPRSPYAEEQANWRQAEEGGGGWLATQDLVALDDRLDLSLRGRTNRQVSVGGLKVNLEEIESKLAEHPHIARCCVVDYAHPVYGTYIEAFVTWNERGERPVAEVHAWLASSLADYKLPRTIRAVPDIPTSPSGKILRGELMKGSPI